MAQPLSILSHTADTFADTLEKHLSKGRLHAIALYKEWCRRGTATGLDPAFNNAKRLLQEICSLTDFAFPVLHSVKEEGETRKFLTRTTDGYEIESVLLPMQAGNTLCISSQVGCRIGCTFCETGRMGLLRHLEPFEIVGQLFVARHILKCEVRNIVFMGMGEPLDNFDNVAQAIRVFKDPMGFDFGKNHLTLSTSGIIPGIQRLLEDPSLRVNLAVSINAPNDEVRNKIMPINRRYRMADLRAMMERYCAETGEEILTAYVLIDGVNDLPQHAEELASYLAGLPVKINLIPYNPQSLDRFQRAAPEAIVSFKNVLHSKGFRTLLRQTHGREIMAACGQLGNVELRKSLRK